MATDRSNTHVALATNREIGELQERRAQAEKDFAVTTTVGRIRGEARLGQLTSAVTEARQRFDAQVGAIIKDLDDQIARVAAKAGATTGPAKQRLETVADALRRHRNAVETTAKSLQQAAAPQWAAATEEFEESIDELRLLRENQAAAIN